MTTSERAILAGVRAPLEEAGGPRSPGPALGEAGAWPSAALPERAACEAPGAQGARPQAKRPPGAGPSAALGSFSGPEGFGDPARLAEALGGSWSVPLSVLSPGAPSSPLPGLSPGAIPSASLGFSPASPAGPPASPWGAEPLAGGFSGREAADSLALEAAPDPSRSPPSEPPAYWGSPGAIWDDGAKVLKAALSLLPSAADLLEAKTPASLPLGGPRLVASPVVVSESAQEPAGAQGARASSLKDPSSRPKGISGLKPPPYVGPFSVEDIRRDFPILSERLRGGRPLAWLDNAATTQKPRAVIERLSSFYSHENSNVHRGAHELAERATDAYEGAREAVARFIGAKGPENIVFTRGTTEGLNLVARAFAAPRIGPGDEIVLTVLEHHANIVPWQLLAQEAGAKLAIAPVDGDGQIILSEYAALFGPRTKFASVAHVSNALGTVTPLAELVAIAKAAGVPIAVDAAQSVSHLPLNVTALGADFLVFSGHKIYGPTGVGVVYGTLEALEEARPYQGGGNMIADVTFERTVYQPPPKKFEAGTQNIAGAVGLAAALDYLSRLGLANVAAYEEALLSYGESLLRAVPGLRLIGTAKAKASVSSFVIEGKSLEAVAAHLSRAGIAVRAGHHCAQPILRSFGLEGTVRPSIAFYNTPEELELLADLLWDLASK